MNERACGEERISVAEPFDPPYRFLIICMSSFRSSNAMRSNGGALYHDPKTSTQSACVSFCGTVYVHVEAAHSPLVGV